jgi:hypothetical protein
MARVAQQINVLPLKSYEYKPFEGLYNAPVARPIDLIHAEQLADPCRPRAG